MTRLQPFTRLDALVVSLLLAAARWPHAAADRGDDGQATAEYALVLIGVAAIAMAIVSFVTRTNIVDKLLDGVFGHLIGKVL